MSGYKYKAQVTQMFGVEFRSKLEAEWAIEFQDRRLNWSYIDDAWHDFTVEGDTVLLKIEVKPQGRHFMEEAVKRIPDGESMLLIQGRPSGGPLCCFCERSTPFTVILWPTGSFVDCNNLKDYMGWIRRECPLTYEIPTGRLQCTAPLRTYEMTSDEAAASYAELAEVTRWWPDGMQSIRRDLTPEFICVEDHSGWHEDEFAAYMLRCPVCGFDYNHICDNERMYGYDDLWDGQKWCNTKELPAGYNWKGRGSGHSLIMHGECGHAWRLNVGFHKGNSYIFATRCREEDDPDAPLVQEERDQE